MSDLPEEWSFLENAWRFARVLTGCPHGTAKIFQDSLEELLRHPQADDPERASHLLHLILRRRSLKYPARCELDGLAAQLHRQLEPARSALTWSYLGVFSSRDLPAVLDLDPKVLAHDMGKARAGLEGSTGRALSAEDFDAGAARALQSLPIDSAGDAQIRSAAEALEARHGGIRFSVRNPATIAVGLGFLLLVAVLTWHFLGRAGVFPDEAIKIATAGAKAGPEQFEPVDEKAGELQDWFMLKGFDDFRVPAGLENFRVVGVRNFKIEGEPIGQAAVRENTMFFYCFRARPFGIGITPEKSWRITEVDQSVLAIREEGGVCFLICFRGTKKDMRRVLQEAVVSR